MHIKTINVRISGRVQGVFFRHYTKLKADSLGLNGWVRNRNDGSVEALISGTEEHISKMIQWLHHGPNSAIVKELDINDVEGVEPGYSSFEIVF